MHTERCLGNKAITIHEFKTVANLIDRAVTSDFLDPYPQIHFPTLPKTTPICGAASPYLINWRKDVKRREIRKDIPPSQQGCGLSSEDDGQSKSATLRGSL